MNSKFQRGDVVIQTAETTVPRIRQTVMIVRSVFSYADTKEDGKQSLGDISVDPDTPVYFCSDCRGNTYFIPERYKDATSQHPIETLQLASPSDELNMVMLDDIRSIKYIVCKQNQYRRYNTSRYTGRRFRTEDGRYDDEDWGDAAIPAKVPKNPVGGGFLSRLFQH